MLGLLVLSLPALGLCAWLTSALFAGLAGSAPEAVEPAAMVNASPADADAAAPESVVASARRNLRGGPTRAGLEGPEPPLLQPLVDNGVLPPLRERIPLEAKVMDGPDTPADPQANPYGGTWLRLATSEVDLRVIEHRLSGALPLRWLPDASDVVPHIARSVEANADNTVFTMTLREGHRWSDGAPFTTADVMYWWNHEVHDPAIGDGQVPEWLLHAGDAATLEATSPTELIIRFPRPNGLFREKLASVGSELLFLSPAHYLRRYHPTLGDTAEQERLARLLGQPSPTALYRRLKEWKNTEMPRLWPWIVERERDSPPYVLIRNPYYFCVDSAGRQLPYVDRMQFDVQTQQLLALSATNGQVSMQARGLGFDKYTDLVSRRDAGDYEVLEWVASGPAWVIHPNLNRVSDPADPDTGRKAAVLSEKKFRQALSLAIDRDRIVEAEYLGLARPTADLFMPNSPWFPESSYQRPEQDLAKAEALLDEIGLKRPRPGAMRRFADGSPMTFFLDFAPFTGPGPVDFVVDDWARIGVRAVARSRSTPLFMLSRNAARFDFLIWTGESDHQPLLSARHFVPFGLHSFWAVRWGQWYEDGGLFYPDRVAGGPGVAPPPGHPVREAMRIHHEALEAPTRARQLELFAELREVARENVWTLQIASPPPQPVVVDRDLRNVPDVAFDGFLYRSPSHANIESFFFASRENSPGAVAAAREALRERERLGNAAAAGNANSALGREVSVWGWLFRGLGVLALVGLGIVAVRRPFIGKRILVMVPTLLVLSVAIYIVVQLPPGDNLTIRLIQLEAMGEPNAQQQIAELRELYHFDESYVSRYARWSGLRWFLTFDPADTGLLQGDLGRSMQNDRPVNDLIGDRLLLTVGIALGTIALTWLIAIPVGVYSAVRQYTPGDYVVTVVSFLGMCVPPFLLALVFMAIAGVSGLFSAEYAATPEWTWGKFVDLLKHIWIPILVLGLGGTGAMIRVMRANMLDELRKPYVTTARAKGVGPVKTVAKYPLRIAANPFISRIGSLFPQLVSGGAIVAIVLSLPTVGPMLLTALFNEDTELAASLLMVLSVLGVMGTLVSDLLLLALDPRIRFEGGTR